jgi:hypothetical protein
MSLTTFVLAGLLTLIQDKLAHSLLSILVGNRLAHPLWEEASCSYSTSLSFVGLFHGALCRAEYIVWDRGSQMNYKGLGRKWLPPNRGTIHVFAWKNWGNPRKILRIISVRDSNLASPECEFRLLSICHPKRCVSAVGYSSVFRWMSLHRHFQAEGCRKSHCEENRINLASHRTWRWSDQGGWDGRDM